jgi:hypothetical protein
VMPPRPSLHSFLLMAASTSAAAGDSALLRLAARRRRLPPALAAAAAGHRVRLLHSLSGPRLPRRAPRRAELACCFGTVPAPAVPAGPVVPRSTNGNNAPALLSPLSVLPLKQLDVAAAVYGERRSTARERGQRFQWGARSEWRGRR